MLMDIVRFKGGLGNQMFQYALAEALRGRGRQVMSSLGFYELHTGVRPFVLDRVFPNVVLEMVDEDIFKAIDTKWQMVKADPQQMSSYWDNIKNVFFFVEQHDSVYDSRVFDTDGAVYVGYWQTERYFRDIKSEIMDRFCFKPDNIQLIRYGKHIFGKYYSIHIRQGDYLENLGLYGGICTEKYYRDAVEYIKHRDKAARFIVFSDDLNSVKTSLLSEEDDIIYFCKEEYEEYEDWYDMYLMTQCKGNVIANSSFSWWGAWLNQYKDKIVVAPKTWVNGKNTVDIWCDDWIVV